jgi:1,4-alpha-glucan branching enzyme
VRGSWDSNGGYSDDWTEFQMQEEVGQDGCPILKASIALDSADKDKTFKWGVVPDGPQGSNFGGIPTEVPDVNSVERYRQFRLNSGGTTPQIERYYFTWGGRLGANKRLPGSTAPRLRFAVWAPNAQDVQAVFGKSDNGYITNEGVGIDPARPVVPISRSTDGIWEGAAPGDFENFKSLPYMYRIVNTQGQTLYRTDIFSRSQIGKGAINPIKGAWPGTVDSLDGTVSCSMVIDPDVVRRSFESTPAGAEPDLIPAASRTTAA